MRFGVDLTACWRPRVGMVTLAVNLTHALEAASRDHQLTIFASRERPESFEDSNSKFVLSPHRDELANKLYWLPAVEAGAGLDVILYPYWPCPPRRRQAAPAAVTFVHDVGFRLRPDEVPWQQRAYLGTLLPSALERSAALVCPSETTKRDLLECYPLPGLEHRVHVVPEGPSGLGEPVSELPSGLEPGFLLAVGTIELRKNYRRLAEAYRQLRDAPPLVVAGGPGWDGGREQRFLETVPGIRVLGRVPDATLARLYKEAAALVFPSLYEGFGLPLLDAMAAGVPSVISNVGALPELAAGAALEVDPTDTDAIARGITTVLHDSALRQRLSKEGLGRARQFSWDTAASSVLTVLEQAGAAP